MASRSRASGRRAVGSGVVQLEGGRELCSLRKSIILLEVALREAVFTEGLPQDAVVKI